MNIFFRLMRTIDQKPLHILGAGILTYVLFFVFLTFWKYDHLLYNALDLGIYTQVFESFRTGNFWYSSIQQTSYLGDHFEPFLLVLLPFYLIFPTPKTLLILQTIFLALPAIPLYFLARHIFQFQIPNSKFQIQRWALVASFFYLFNPLVHSINLFEFHMLPFALVFLFCALLFYHQKRLFWFILSLCCALLIREDIPLVIFAFGILAAFDRRRWYWICLPVIFACWWFVFAMSIISSFNADSSYKFLTFYPWIFENSFIENIFFIPQTILGSLENIELMVGFSAIFLLLPLFAPRYLLLALFAFLQVTLTHGSSTVLTTHYSTLFLPGLFSASLFGFQKIFQLLYEQKARVAFLRDRGLIVIVSLSAFLGVVVCFSPIIPSVLAITKERAYPEYVETQFQQALMNEVPQNDPSVFTFSLLPEGATRQNLSALFYVLWGKKQFSQSPYIPSSAGNYVAVDSDELLAFCYASPQERLCEQSDNNLRDFITSRRFSLAYYGDRFLLFSKRPSNDALYAVSESVPDAPNIHHYSQGPDIGNVQLLAFTNPFYREILLPTTQTSFPMAEFSLFWRKHNGDKRMYGVEVTLFDKQKNVLRRDIYPLAHGIYPVSDWQTESVVQTNYHLLLPHEYSDAYSISVRLADIEEGIVTADGLRSVKTTSRPLYVGSAVDIGTFVLSGGF